MSEVSEVREVNAHLLETLGVESWEKLPGTFCRVRQRHDEVEEIGHLLKDQWFSGRHES